MIVEAGIVVPLPLHALATRLRRLLVEPELGGYASSSISDGEASIMRAGVAGVTKQVAVQALEPQYRPHRVIIPIRWVATGVTGELFPALDGNLELRAVDDDTTQFTLIGSYRPPFGHSGEMLDQHVMRRVARRTLTTFLTRLATTVAEPQPAPLRSLRPQTDS